MAARVLANKRRTATRIARRPARPKPPPKSSQARGSAHPVTSARRRQAAGKKGPRPVKKSAEGRFSMVSQQNRQGAGSKQVAARKRLLSDSKSTSAALSILEKGIRLVYRREYKRARAEFESIAKSHPREYEIIARSKSYLQICDREESNQKKPSDSLSNDQLYNLGVLEHNRGHYEEAIRFFRRYLAKHPDRDYVYYSMAASQALMEEFEAAVKSLRQAIAINEDNRIYAKNDQDFVSLRENKDFAELLGLSVGPGNKSAHS